MPMTTTIHVSLFHRHRHQTPSQPHSPAIPQSPIPLHVHTAAHVPPTCLAPRSAPPAHPDACHVPPPQHSAAAGCPPARSTRPHAPLRGTPREGSQWRRGCVGQKRFASAAKSHYRTVTKVSTPHACKISRRRNRLRQGCLGRRSNRTPCQQRHGVNTLRFACLLTRGRKANQAVNFPGRNDLRMMQAQDNRCWSKANAARMRIKS